MNGSKFAALIAILAAFMLVRSLGASAPTIAPPIGATVVSYDNSLVTPDGTTVRAFIPTGSLRTNCLVTLAESNNAVTGISTFCAPRTFEGQNGLLVSIFFPAPVPAGLVLSSTVYQEGAHRYGTPVFYTGI